MWQMILISVVVSFGVSFFMMLEFARRFDRWLDKFHEMEKEHMLEYMEMIKDSTNELLKRKLK
ncbi:hypothetical protein B8A39_06575 [Dolosigranulum pigrum]|uniref:hypothetical protein n=1 Tax=Dolosigranulum pigrum TaxID=29394 RepID=UPI000DC03376|nr:hypothetical protein [Dolosigranulum pigrum]QTJ57567.1 hypothetical protein FE335_08895 [Dolosigranulum pigrum]RAN51502.1 hypothetical protein B8A39_06575 [Dolosigranulum pigrum]DAJ26476.1 MAG TPA: Sec-independent protein translocase protein tatAd protein, PROTEIN TRANSPORT [Caudoviricetes sp.]